MLDRKLDDLENNSQEHSTMAAKLVLTHNYTYVRFWNVFVISFEPTRKFILAIIFGAIIFSLYTFGWRIEVCIVKA